MLATNNAITIKEYTFILTFGQLTSDEDINQFKFYLDNESISHEVQTYSNTGYQFIFRHISDEEYKMVKYYYYANLYRQNTIYDINDLTFMSFNNYEEEF